jgi:hypothetical protein
VPPADSKDNAAPDTTQSGSGDANGASTAPVIEPTGTAGTNASGSEEGAKADSSANGASQGADANKTDGSQASDDKKDSKKESSSKKKKGIKKVIPW